MYIKSSIEIVVANSLDGVHDLVGSQRPNDNPITINKALDNFLLFSTSFYFVFQLHTLGECSVDVF